MKKTIFLLSILLSYFNSNCQDYVTFFYNSNWELTAKERADYFRVGLFDTTNYCFVGEVKDFYKDGKVQMTGNYINCYKQGLFTFYYPNGQVMKTGKYQNNERIGIWSYYFSSGILKQKIHFEKDEFYVIEYNDSTGKTLISKENWTWHNEYDALTTFKTIIVEGEYYDSLKNGEWNFYTTENHKIYKEIYKKNKFKRRICFDNNCCFEDQDNIYNKIPDDNKFLRTESIRVDLDIGVDKKVLKYLPEVYILNILDYRTKTDKSPCVNIIPITRSKMKSELEYSGKSVIQTVDNMSVPLIGINSFKEKFREKLISYYSQNIDKEIEGVLICTFTINETGNISNVIVNKSFNPSHDNRIIEIFKNISNWKSGSNNGIPVSVNLTITIKFIDGSIKVNFGF